MELTEQAIKEFAQIWAEDHPGEPIDQGKLKLAALAVLQAVEVLYNDDTYGKQ